MQVILIRRIRAAIEESDQLDDIDRAALLGAFQMATAFLFDIEGPE